MFEGLRLSYIFGRIWPQFSSALWKAMSLIVTTWYSTHNFCHKRTEKGFSQKLYWADISLMAIVLVKMMLHLVDLKRTLHIFFHLISNSKWTSAKIKFYPTERWNFKVKFLPFCQYLLTIVSTMLVCHPIELKFPANSPRRTNHKESWVIFGNDGVFNHGRFAGNMIGVSVSFEWLVWMIFFLFWLFSLSLHVRHHYLLFLDSYFPPKCNEKGHIGTKRSSKYFCLSSSPHFMYIL